MSLKHRKMSCSSPFVKNEYESNKIKSMDRLREHLLGKTVMKIPCSFYTRHRPHTLSNPLFFCEKRKRLRVEVLRGIVSMCSHLKVCNMVILDALEYLDEIMRVVEYSKLVIKNLKALKLGLVSVAYCENLKKRNVQLNGTMWRRFCHDFGRDTVSHISEEVMDNMEVFLETHINLQNFNLHCYTDMLREILHKVKVPSTLDIRGHDEPDSEFYDLCCGFMLVVKASPDFYDNIADVSIISAVVFMASLMYKAPFLIIPPMEIRNNDRLFVPFGKCYMNEIQQVVCFICSVRLMQIQMNRSDVEYNIDCINKCSVICNLLHCIAKNTDA